MTAYNTHLSAMNAARKQFGKAWKEQAQIEKIDGAYYVQLIQIVTEGEIGSVGEMADADQEAALAQQEEASPTNEEWQAMLAQADQEADKALDLNNLHLTHKDNCPGCGIGLDNGICDWDHLKEVQGKNARQYQTREWACMACDFEWGPVRAHASKVIVRQSTALKPTKLVWHIADEMYAQAAIDGQPAPSRKEVQEECVRRGIATGTARTQFQAWKTARDNDAKNAGKAAEASARINGKGI